MNELEDSLYIEGSSALADEVAYLATKNGLHITSRSESNKIFRQKRHLFKFTGTKRKIEKFKQAVESTKERLK